MRRMVSTLAGSPSEGIVVCMGGERVCRICGIGVRVVRKGWKPWRDREILGYVQGQGGGRTGCYSYGVVGWGKDEQTHTPLA